MFSQEYLEINLKNELGHRLLTDYEELRFEVESLTMIVEERLGIVFIYLSG